MSDPNKPKDDNTASALVRAKPATGLAALARKKSSAALAATDRARITAMEVLAAQRTEAALDRFSSGTIKVEIAADLSASTGPLHESLKNLSGTLQTRIATALPLAKISYGVFGGGGLVETGGSKRVLDQAHKATDGWESSFGEFATKYAETPDPHRQDVLISFHDARPKNDEAMADAVKKINSAGAIVVIIYIPSSELSGGDKQALMDLASSEMGFRRGIFIDLSGVDYSDPGILGEFMNNLIEAVAEANKEGAKQAGGDADIAGIRAMTKLKQLAGAVVTNARALSNRRGPKGFLT